MKKKAVFLLFLSLPVFSYEKKWDDRNGPYVFTFNISQNNKNFYLFAEGKYKQKQDFKIRDFILDCDLDPVLELYEDSVERVIIDGKITTLFAYQIDCVGGITNFQVKYFAIQDGIKYKLTGEEFEESTDVLDKISPPTPNSNLRKKIKLQQYMQSRWPIITLKKY